MQHGLIPASQNTERLDSECPIDVVRGRPREACVRTVLTPAYALGGGQNAALVFRRVDGG